MKRAFALDLYQRPAYFLLPKNWQSESIIFSCNIQLASLKYIFAAKYG